MRWNPDDEVNNDVIPAGEYDAVVTASKEKTSQSDNPMIELMLTVYGPDGENPTVFDNLVSTPRALWKLRRFCASAGLDWAAGHLEARDCQDVNVRVLLEIEGKRKDPQNGKEYPEKNKVADYVLRELASAASSSTSKATSGIPDDDIPF